MTKKTPRHKLVYETIRKNIEDHIYEVDSLLPSENEMCSLFEVTRPTIRQALTRLENEGYILRQQGKGSIVQDIPQGMGILSVKGVTQALGSRGELTTKILKKPIVTRWPESFMFNLSEKEKSLGCIAMWRLRSVNNQPVIMEKTHLVNAYLPRFCQKKFENRSLFDTLRVDYNIEIVGGKQNIRAVTADKAISKVLKIPLNQAIIHMERSIKTNKKNLRIFSELFCFTDEHYIIDEF